MAKASRRDRAYFKRIADANRALPEETPPASLEEVLQRMERMRQCLGSLARPGIDDDGARGDLDGHLRFLAKLRMRMQDGTRHA